MVHMDAILAILQEHTFSAKKNKYVFKMQRIFYLELIINIAGMEMDQTKVQSIYEWPIPRTLTQL